MNTSAVDGRPLRRRKTIIQTVCTTGLALALLAWSLGPALAHPPAMDEVGSPMPPPDGPGHHPGRAMAPRPPTSLPASPLRSVEQLPPQAVEVRLETPRFYFHEGLFFTRSGERFVVVPAPPGAIIPSLPNGFTSLQINGEPFYLAANVFYQPHAQGYAVVASPVDPAPKPVPPPPMPCAPVADTVTMTVHLAAGGTAPVVLKRHAHGWIGPKGEIYESLPSEQQLAPYYR